MPRNTSKLGKLMNFLAFALAFFIIAYNMGSNKDNSENRQSLPSQTEQKNSPVPLALQELDKKFQQAIDLKFSKKYAQALSLIDDVIEQSYTINDITDDFKFKYLNLKANLHIELWQYADAHLTWKEALPYASPYQKRMMQKSLTRIETVIEDINKERKQKSVYTATPNTGPAGRLEGKIGIVNLFIVDKGRNSWGIKQRDSSMRALERSKQWLSAAAEKYNKNISFTHKNFIINRNPYIKRLKISKHANAYKAANKIVRLATKQLGSKTVLSFINKMKREMQVDQVMLLLHINRSERSFARRCINYCGRDGEYTFVLENVRSKRWQELEYAQTHESLHLFGADDLYNIKGATYYATRDIMNYPSKILSGSTMEPITAYAIGITNQPPFNTPFKLKTY